MGECLTPKVMVLGDETFEKRFSPENELPEPVALGFPGEQCRQHPAHLPPSKALESTSIYHQTCKTPRCKGWNGGLQPGNPRAWENLNAPVTTSPVCHSYIRSHQGPSGGHQSRPAHPLNLSVWSLFSKGLHSEGRPLRKESVQRASFLNEISGTPLLHPEEHTDPLIRKVALLTGIFHPLPICYSHHGMVLCSWAGEKGEGPEA